MIYDKLRYRVAGRIQDYSYTQEGGVQLYIYI